jgi:tRNA threonylcarbamoyladenosine biosynthesis protein TsaB
MSVRESESERNKVVLAVDTCLGACSVALLQDGEILAHHWQAMERGHAEALAPMVEEAMRGHDFAVLDRLAVTVGPGTFTGQRVGLSFMRGLRLALKKPLTGITSLGAMGAQAIVEANAPMAAVAHDARRGEVYFELVTSSGDPLHFASLLTFEKALEIVRDFPTRIALAGTATSRIAELLQAEDRPVVPTRIIAPDAIWVGRLASREPPTDTPPAPLYLRAPDAKLPGGKTLA